MSFYKSDESKREKKEREGKRRSEKETQGKEITLEGNKKEG